MPITNGKIFILEKLGAVLIEEIEFWPSFESYPDCFVRLKVEPVSKEETELKEVIVLDHTKAQALLASSLKDRGFTNSKVLALKRIATDNGPQFTSQKFKDFFEVNGIKHTCSATYHLSMNREAERTTPHSTTGVTPSNLLMGRRIRCKLDSLFPSLQSNLEEKGYKKLETLPKVRHFSPCSNVLVRSYNTPEMWVLGEIVKEIGDLHYGVQVGGNIVKRHVDQLQPLNENVVDHMNVRDEKFSEVDESNINQDAQTSDVDSESIPVPVQDKVRVLPYRRNKGKPPERLDL
ncbi:uncharacterized protein [Palaemon carinicauda]|uniref:uncharacterized protein n=1 Tax=Palaemon carinicauda TaxID=392227 RepID=UPI0035B66316